MKKSFGGTILNVSARLIVPFSMMYAIYVFAAGESGPGGGFQAGAVLALGIICARLVKGKAASYRIKGALAASIAGIGAFFYCLMGWLTMLNGGQFLEYGRLPFGHMEYEKLHEAGISLIEAGVTVCVMMTIVAILEALLRGEERKEEND